MGYNMKKTGEESNTGFESLPEDRYNVKVVEARMEIAKTGTEMIATTFEVLDGKFKNRKLWNNFTLTDKSMVYLYSFLKGAESDLINAEDAEASDFIAKMPGMRVSVFAEPAITQNGNPTNDLSRWGKVAPELAPVAGANEPVKKGDMFT